MYGPAHNNAYSRVVSGASPHQSITLYLIDTSPPPATVFPTDGESDTGLQLRAAEITCHSPGACVVVSVSGDADGAPDAAVVMSLVVVVGGATVVVVVVVVVNGAVVVGGVVAVVMVGVVVVVVVVVVGVVAGVGVVVVVVVVVVGVCVVVVVVVDVVVVVLYDLSTSRQCLPRHPGGQRQK